MKMYVIVLFICLCAGLQAEDVVLVSHGQARAVIVVPATPSPTENFAAKELQRYIATSTGAKLVIVKDVKSADRTFISIGRTESAVRIGYTRDEGSPDSYIIRRDGYGIFIIGRGDRGTIYGVYDFLRRYVGCRWIMPGTLGEIIPRHADIAVPEMNIEEVPAFRFRIAAGFRNNDYIDWATKNRLQIWSQRQSDWSNNEMLKRGGYIKGTMHHAFNSILPKKKYFAKHPEYFALLGGRRVAGPGSQLCVSNAEVVRIVTKAAIAYFDKYPEATFFSLCPNDNQNWCECKACRAYDTETMVRWRVTYPIVSDRYFHFVNQVADTLAQKYPDKLLYTFAYQNYTWPPRKYRPRKNVIVSLCHMVPACYSHPLTDSDCPKNRKFDEILNDWARLHGNMWFYAYTCKSMWEQMPWPIARRLAQDIRHLHKSGFQGFFSQGSQGVWGQLGINFYVMAQMLWNPNSDVEVILKDYFTLAFGVATQAMSDFYKNLEAGFTARDVHVHHEADIWGPKVLTPQVQRRCNAALAQAEKLAANDDMVRQRIASIAAAYRYATLRVEALEAENKWRTKHDSDALTHAVHAYREIIELSKLNPGGESLLPGSVRRYVFPRYDKIALPYDALLAPDNAKQYRWETIKGVSSFEVEESGKLSGWGTLGEQPDCGVSLSRERAHAGEYSLRLWSNVKDENSPRMTALKHDWVIISSLSNRIKVEQGNAIVVIGWVFVPHKFEQTKRGATLGLVGYDATGKSPHRWRAGNIESRCFNATEGWHRLIIARTIDTNQIKRVSIRLAVSGIGECYFDDIQLLRGVKK